MENYSDVFPLSQTNIIKSLAQHFPFQSRVQAPSPCHEFGQADSAWTPFCPRPPLSRLYGNRGPLPADEFAWCHLRSTPLGQLGRERGTKQKGEPRFSRRAPMRQEREASGHRFGAGVDQSGSCVLSSRGSRRAYYFVPWAPDLRQGGR